MQLRGTVTTVFVLTVIALSDSAGAYEYGNGTQAPHPNSKYWRITGQTPPLTRDASGKHIIHLLRAEHALLNEETRLLRKQINLLTGHGQCVDDAPTPHLSVELHMLDRSLSALERLLSRVRRARRTFRR